MCIYACQADWVLSLASLTHSQSTATTMTCKTYLCHGSLLSALSPQLGILDMLSKYSHDKDLQVISLPWHALKVQPRQRLASHIFDMTRSQSTAMTKTCKSYLCHDTLSKYSHDKDLQVISLPWHALKTKTCKSYLCHDTLSKYSHDNDLQVISLPWHALKVQPRQRFASHIFAMTRSQSTATTMTCK